MCFCLTLVRTVSTSLEEFLQRLSGFLIAPLSHNLWTDFKLTPNIWCENPTNSRLDRLLADTENARLRTLSCCVSDVRNTRHRWFSLAWIPWESCQNHFMNKEHLDVRKSGYIWWMLDFIDLTDGYCTLPMFFIDNVFQYSFCMDKYFIVQGSPNVPNRWFRWGAKVIKSM